MMIKSDVAKLTGPIDGDRYVREVLVARQEAWHAANPEASRDVPPLLEWFIQPGDEDFVVVPGS